MTQIAVDLRHCRVLVRLEVGQGRVERVARRQPVAVDGLPAGCRLASRDARHLPLPIWLPCLQDPALPGREAGPELVVVLREAVQATSREAVDSRVMLHLPVRIPTRETRGSSRQRRLCGEQTQRKRGEENAFHTSKDERLRGNMRTSYDAPRRSATAGKLRVGSIKLLLINHFWLGYEGRRRADLNRCTRLCRPLPNPSATSPRTGSLKPRAQQGTRPAAYLATRPAATRPQRATRRR